ncbi:LysR family transcriptional regulator [Bacillus mycoides]|uniref:LysR family transcriptional regulator n=1 Tax=Bacillus mycoides TaxID=1405 RepID=UPI003D07B1C7
MNVEDFHTFVVVAEKQSISRAAEKLNTVQSNITARIKRLEAQYNAQLFYRHRHGVILTPIGVTLLKYAHKILFLIEESQKEIKYSNVPMGTLKLGSMETTAAIRLPTILSNFNETFPKVELSLETNTTEELIKAVLMREIDGAFIADSASSPLLAEIPVFHETLELLAKNGKKSIVSLEDLKDQKLIVFKSGCFYRKKLENWLLSKGIVPQNTMELNTLDGIIGCVKAGLGITMLTRAVANQMDFTGGLTHYPLPHETGEITTYFIYRKDIVKTHAFNKFLELLPQITKPVNTKIF